jgi:hypothetical protein
MNARAHYEAMARSPESTMDSGLSSFMDQKRMASRTPREFTASLLSPEELDRVRALLYGPQRPARLDKRLISLGLAKIVLGKVVATKAAWEAIWQERYELRRGNDKRPLKLVQLLEVSSHREAMTTAWNTAKQDVGPRWQHHLLQMGEEPRWTIFLPPPRQWDDFAPRPYVLEIKKLNP